MRVLVCVVLLLAFSSLISAKSLFGWWEGAPKGSEAPVSIVTDAAQKYLKKRFSVVSFYDDLCPGDYMYYDDTMLRLWNLGYVPLFGLRPNGCQHTRDPQHVIDIAEGRLDPWIEKFANETRVYLNGADGLWGTADDRKAFISFGPEFNGDWESPYGEAEKYKAMWRKFVGIFRKYLPADHQDHLQFIWTAVAVDSNSKTNPVENFYPGSDLVDWIGIDGYNWDGGKNGWRTPKQVFAKMILRLRKKAPGKPLAIIETGTTSVAKNNLDCSQSRKSCAAKNAWIKSALKFFKLANAKMVIWFQQNKEHDWHLFNAPRCWNDFLHNPAHSEDPKDIVSYVKCYGLKKAKVGGRTYVTFPAFKGFRNKYYIAGSVKKHVSKAAFMGKA